jgi:hypothetical protein
MLILHFLRFHPTLLPYLATQLPAERRADAENRCWRGYYRAAKLFYQLGSQHPHEARAIAVRELPNLLRALQLIMATGEKEIIATFAGRIVKFLDHFGRWREGDVMLSQVQQWAKEQIAKPSTGEGKLTNAEYMLLSRQAKALLQQGRAIEAEQVFLRLLQRLEAGAAYDVAYHQAITHRNLGLRLPAGRPAATRRTNPRPRAKPAITRSAA